MFEYERERAGGQVLLFSFASNKDTVVFHKMVNFRFDLDGNKSKFHVSYLNYEKGITIASYFIIF